MPLQKRISLVAAATVAVAVAFAVLISYFAVRDQLVGQISNELRNQAAVIESNFEHGRPDPRTSEPAPADRRRMPGSCRKPGPSRPANSRCQIPARLGPSR